MPNSGDVSSIYVRSAAAFPRTSTWLVSPSTIVSKEGGWVLKPPKNYVVLSWVIIVKVRGFKPFCIFLYLILVFKVCPGLNASCASWFVAIFYVALLSLFLLYLLFCTSVRTQSSYCNEERTCSDPKIHYIFSYYIFILEKIKLSC